ncbi:MAG: polysaccharide pyruvyl transferase family protein [Lachnospiraceae bacterium]|nr:polysaccharide pyruvyl transferase family protein [Lachnospiraceae bacterium]
MAKVGILTLYHKNYNYGGILQAYALQKTIEKEGHECSQICYERDYNNCNKWQDSKKKSLGEIVGKVNDKISQKVDNALNKKKHALINEKIALRNKMFDKFIDSINHTDVFKRENIAETNELFDTFVVGSDQVWNFTFTDESYLLDFAAADKKKIAYAASFGKSKLSNKENELVKNLASSFKHISVREQAGVNILAENGFNNIDLVLDPTLLLERNDWEQVAAMPDIDGQYIFSYMLGNNPKQRQRIMKLGKQLGLKVVTFPMVAYGDNDTDFGDIQVYEAGPAEFVGLIRNAKYVLTDSFHACVFSAIFAKKIGVMLRYKDDSGESMNSRIYSLLNMFGMQDRIIGYDDEIDMNMLDSDIDYVGVHNNISNMRQASLGKLVNYIND